MHTFWIIASALAGFASGAFVVFRFVARPTGGKSVPIRLLMGCTGSSLALVLFFCMAALHRSPWDFLQGPMLGMCLFLWVVGGNLVLGCRR